MPRTGVRRLQAVIPPIRSWRLAFLVLGTGVPSAAAQGVRDPDPEVGAFRDSLARSDPDQLRSIERALLARVRRERTNPAIHLRLGMLAFRLGEYSDAASEFKWTTQLAPQWGVAWFGLGHAELALGETVDTSKLGRQALLAKDAWARASHAFARALAADPTQVGNLEALVRERMAFDRPAPADIVRDGVRRAAARTATAAIGLGLGRIELAMGDSAAAIAAFDAASALPGGPAVGRLESARVRLTRADPRGQTLYFEAAALDDSAAVARLRRDVAWVATGAELDQFDRLSGADRSRFLGEFWARRDRGDLRQTGERLREHYRRLAVAARSFPNPDDQRTAVMVRHGEPTARATARVPGLAGNESWWYGRAEGELVVHFVSGADPTYFGVVESLFDLIVERGTPAGDDQVTGDVTDQLLRSRAQLSPFYQSAAAGRRDQLGPFRIREREIGKASRNLALTTDRFPLRFARDLPVRAQWLSLGSGTDRPGTDLIFAIPLFATDSGGSVLEGTRRVRLRAVAWDSLGVPAVAVDTVITGTVSDDRAGSRFLRGHLPVRLAAGRFTARVAIEVGTRGSVVTTDELVVRPQGADWQGDVALGSRATGSSVAIGGLGQSVESDPWGGYRRSDTLSVYGMAMGRAGSVPTEARVRVRSVRSDGKVDSWRGWPDAPARVPLQGGPDGRVRLALALPLRKLKVGLHEVEVGIVDGVREVSRRVARFVVTDDEK